MTNSVKVLLFDIGGVFVQLSGVDQMLQWTEGIHTEQDLWKLWLASPSVKAFETGQMAPDDFAKEFVREFTLPVSSQVFIDTFITWTTTPFEGGRELISAINGNYTTASLSNTNELHWDNLCNTLDIEGLFQHNFPSHKLHCMKPDPRAFQHVLDALGVKASEVLFFDDTQVNIDAAQDMGMGAHLVFGVDHLQQTLKELGIL